MADEYELLEKIEATFTPIRRDNLRPDAERMIGKRLRLQAAWVVEEGPYAWQWAFTQADFDPTCFIGWVPECDLSEIERLAPTPPAIHDDFEPARDPALVPGPRWVAELSFIPDNPGAVFNILPGTFSAECESPGTLRYRQWEED